MQSLPVVGNVELVVRVMSAIDSNIRKLFNVSKCWLMDGRVR